MGGGVSSAHARGGTGGASSGKVGPAIMKRPQTQGGAKKGLPWTDSLLGLIPLLSCVCVCVRVCVCVFVCLRERMCLRV